MTLTPVSRHTSREALAGLASSRRQPLSVAHRGASASAPENTLAAVRAAIAQGSDMVERDVQRTRDGALVLMHDTTLVRTTNVRDVFGRRRAPWLVGDFDLDEIRQLDAGGWKSPAFEGERVPTLREAAELLRSARTGLVLELKAPALYPGIVADVAGELRDEPGAWTTSMSSGLVVESFDASAASAFKASFPGARVGLLGRPHPARLEEVADWADQVNPHHRVTSKAYVDALHAVGLECLVWTVNTRSALQRAVDLEVDGVMTDHPLLLRNLLAHEGLISSPGVPALSKGTA
jgi:glycerophosphoryl diester phosphodiesterase